MSSVMTVLPNFDETLKNIAKDLHLRTDIDNLGSALGFGSADIGRYYEENSRQGGSYMGTVDMLRTWRNRQTAATAPRKLRKALQKAELNHLADKHLSSFITLPGRIATTKELNNLASLLHGDFYTSLAINLCLEPAEFDNIKRENPALKDANFRMLLKWKTKVDGGLVVDLDKALNESGCGAFTKQYKEH